MNSRNQKSSWAGELQKKRHQLTEKLTHHQNLESFLFYLNLIGLFCEKKKVSFNVKCNGHF